jgi:hypothetical protein
MKLGKAKKGELKSIIDCEVEINHDSHMKIMQASKKREANIKKELRMVILKNIESFNDRVYHSQAIEFKPVPKSVIGIEKR